MDKRESMGFRFHCLPEERARVLAAKLGRQVCAACITHLYTGYEDDVSSALEGSEELVG